MLEYKLVWGFESDGWIEVKSTNKEKKHKQSLVNESVRRGLEY